METRQESIKCKRCNIKERYGRRLICRDCINSDQNEKRGSNPDSRAGEGADYYKRNREKVLAKAKERSINNPQHYLWYTAKKRAYKKGIEFSITQEDVIIPTHCPVLGIELFRGDGKLSGNSPSLDRVDPAKGYIKGNVCVISHKLNAMKNDMTVDTVCRLLSYMKGYQ